MRCFIFLISTCIAALSQGESGLVAMSSVTFGGHIYESSLTISDLGVSPEWKSQTSPPPLLPAKAEAIALSYIGKTVALDEYPPGTQWCVFETALTKSAGIDKWFYRIDLMLDTPGSGGRNSIRIFMLLSGHVTPLTIAPATAGDK